jgi:hypothetical protein
VTAIFGQKEKYMANGNKWEEQREVGDPERGLIVEIHRGLDPFLAIARDPDGHVHIEMDEVQALVEVLSQAAADLAAEQAEAELPSCPSCGFSTLIPHDEEPDTWDCPNCGNQIIFG